MQGREQTNVGEGQVEKNRWRGKKQTSDVVADYSVQQHLNSWSDLGKVAFKTDIVELYKGNCCATVLYFILSVLAVQI